MTSLSSPGPLGNIISRLSGLKNVSGRRVMPGEEDLENMDHLDTDVSGTASPMPDLSGLVPPRENTPEADLGGELTPQSYDVRANTAMPPEEPPEDDNFFYKLGRSLKSSFTPSLSADFSRQFPNVKTEAQTPPIETAQVDMQEGLPPVTASEQEAPQSLFSKIGSSLKEYAQPFSERGHYYGEASPEREQMMEDAQLRTQGIDPNQRRAEQAEIKKNSQAEIMERTDKALENPTTTAVYGASDIVANQPDLQKGFQTITGMNFDEQIASQTKEYEKVLQDIQDQINQEGNGYTEQEQRIQQRILNNQATDQDKYYIGLAVLLPLLVGAFFGKEAALGALGGGAKGFADILGRRQKEDTENEKLLADIATNKGNLALKNADLQLKRLGLPGEIKKNLPKDENEHLVGKEEVTWVDPKDGQEKRGVQIKPGLVALPEYITDKEELKEMRKEANEIYTAINPTKEINKLTGDVIEIASKLKDKNILGQAIGAYVSGKDPGLATKLGETIEYNGRKVNSYVVLEHKLKLLVDAYRQAKGMRALTNTVQEHIDSLFRNPAASFQSYQDTVDQMLYTRDLAQSRLLNTVAGAGFVPEFVAEQLQPEVRGTFNTLNKREGEKEASELLRE